MVVQPLSSSQAKRVLLARQAARPRRDRWASRDWIAAAALSVATAATILWQNAHVAVLWDASYVLDSAARMADGQMPYRDFPFVHAPLTFLIQAAILRLFGHVLWHPVLYAVLAGAAGTVLTWRLVLDTLRGRAQHAWAIALLLAAPLAVVGTYCIIPLPNYDCDCGLAVLAAVWLLRRVEAGPAIGRGVLAGVAACVPLFFKQNIGLPFLAAVVAVVIWVLLLRVLSSRVARRGAALEGERPPLISSPAASPIWVLAGIAVALAAAFLVIYAMAGLGNYLHWTIQFAAQRRLPGARVMLGVYRDPTLLWTLPCMFAAVLLVRSRARGSRWTRTWARLAAPALFAAPFLFAVAALFLYDDADERGDALLALWPMLLVLAAALALARLWQSARMRERATSLAALTPILLLAAIHGAFLSQQLWGSTYGIWPLLVLLLAEMIVFVGEPRRGALQPERDRHSFVPALAGLVAAVLLLCGGFYTASEERLSYAQFPDGPAEHSQSPALRGMATPGPYLPEFDELLHYAAANIPESDGLILIPGEDPFYFATDRVPQFPVLLFDPATDPYAPEQIVTLAQTRNIHWLIVKRNLQLKQDPMPKRDATLKLLLEEFAPAARLRGYDVYRR
jgi:hypothetical protein